MSFLAPWGFALTALAVPLIALYILKIRRKRIKVPSILLWHELTKTERLATPFQKFQRNFLLFLQLLLLLIVAMALARPYIQAEIDPGRSLVLVIDVSASMGARDGDPTRLDTALKGARKALDDLGPEDEVMLVVAGPATEVAVPFTRDASQVREALDAMRPTEAEGDLGEGIQLAVSLSHSRPGVDVLVFSDGGGRDLSDVSIGDAKVRFVPVGAGSDNAGIVALEVRRSPSSDRDRQLFVTVEDFGSSEVPATVEVYLDDKLVGSRTDTVATLASVSMVFDLPPDADGVLRVALDAPGDLLDADDEAYAIVTPTAERKVLLVGVDKLTARVLAADPRFDLSVATSIPTAQATLAYDAVVFETPVPPGMDGQNYFVVGPQNGGPVTFGAELKTPSILGWRRTHPVLRFVEWDAILVARARAITDQGGLVSIVDGDVGPLVLAGERNAGRVVEMAFNPLESDMPLRVAWPVFVLNALGWITENVGEGDGARMVAAGAPFVRRLPEGVDPSAVSATGPDGKRREVQVADNVIRVRDTTDVGIYTLDVGSIRSKFASNLLSQSESRIAPRGTLALANAEVQASEAGMVGRREIWRELLLVALVLLMGEWFAWNRRKFA